MQLSFEHRTRRLSDVATHTHFMHKSCGASFIAFHTDLMKKQTQTSNSKWNVSLLFVVYLRTGCHSGSQRNSANKHVVCTLLFAKHTKPRVQFICFCVLPFNRRTATPRTFSSLCWHFFLGVKLIRMRLGRIHSFVYANTAAKERKKCCFQYVRALKWWFGSHDIPKNSWERTKSRWVRFAREFCIKIDFFFVLVRWCCRCQTLSFCYIFPVLLLPLHICLIELINHKFPLQLNS